MIRQLFNGVVKALARQRGQGLASLAPAAALSALTVDPREGPRVKIRHTRLGRKGQAARRKRVLRSSKIKRTVLNAQRRKEAA